MYRNIRYAYSYREIMYKMEKQPGYYLCAVTGTQAYVYAYFKSAWLHGHHMRKC